MVVDSSHAKGSYITTVTMLTMLQSSKYIRLVPWHLYKNPADQLVATMTFSRLLSVFGAKTRKEYDIQVQHLNL